MEKDRRLSSPTKQRTLCLVHKILQLITFGADMHLILFNSPSCLIARSCPKLPHLVSSPVVHLLPISCFFLGNADQFCRDLSCLIPLLRLNFCFFLFFYPQPFSSFLLRAKNPPSNSTNISVRWQKSPNTE